MLREIDLDLVKSRSRMRSRFDLFGLIRSNAKVERERKSNAALLAVGTGGVKHAGASRPQSGETRFGVRPRTDERRGRRNGRAVGCQTAKLSEERPTPPRLTAPLTPSTARQGTFTQLSTGVLKSSRSFLNVQERHFFDITLELVAEKVRRSTLAPALVTGKCTDEAASKAGSRRLQCG